MPPKSPQAFPFIKPHEDVGTYHPGMSLRDSFAMSVVSYYLSQGFDPDAAARMSYIVADEMTKARK